MIKLQNITFPKPGICYDWDMFFRISSTVDLEKDFFFFDPQTQSITVNKYGRVFFDTYFNSLSIGKWKRYTLVDKISLIVDFSGNFAVSLLHFQYINGMVVQKVIKVDEFYAVDRQTVTIEYPDCAPKGAISFQIEALTDGSILYGGSYVSEVDHIEAIQTVELALNICNFNREKYIYRNMDIIQRYLLNSPVSELRHHIHIFIADNSSSINAEMLPSSCSTVFPQGDFGGAGGFTRGLIEVLTAQKQYALTHVVMMDDDILIEPECLDRLYNFLRLIKAEYRTAFIGGALLRSDFQNIQYINGGEWDLKNCYVMHRIGANLHDLRDLIVNELEDGAKINGWWFHCLPLTQLSLSNLPYPFFFHMDDVEYDLRNCKKLITLNGICVWHDPFEYKPGSQLSYYDTRNVFIAHMVHYSTFNRRAAKKFLSRFFVYLWYYRYKEAWLVMRGIEDALKGPQWLAAQNPEGLLEDILAQGYRKQPMDGLPMRLDYEQYLAAFRGGPPEGRVKRWFRRLTLNGYLLKADHDAIIPMFGPMIRTTYRAKRVLNYDPISDRGYVTEKSYREFFKVLFHYFKVRRLINKRFDTVREEYLEAFPEMTSAPFWRKYLGIEETSLEEVVN